MRPKVSLCMILRDSEATIRAALDSACGLYDELVVVMDSRSADATERIVREEYGARVFVKEWLGFAEMRNESLREARNQWCIILDGDEVIVDHGNFHEALDAIGEHGSEMILSIVETTRAGGNITYTEAQPRVVRRDKCRYRFPIHNQLHGFRQDRVGVTTLRIRAVYTTDLRDRALRSEGPLRKMVDENEPGSPEWLHGRYFLARCYGMVGRNAEAIVEARELFKFAPKEVGFATAWVTLIQSVLDVSGPAAALPLIVEALSHHPHGYSDLWWHLIRLGFLGYLKSCQNPGHYAMIPQLSLPYFEGSEKACELMGITLRMKEEASRAA